MILLSALDALDILPFSTAVAVIKHRFLTDDLLCIKGADWILANYDSTKHRKPDFSNPPPESSKLQKAAYLLLQTYFDDQPDYTRYSKAVNKLKNEDTWPQFINLGAKYLSKDIFNDESTATDLSNPVNDWGMDTLVDNIKSRLLTMVNTSSDKTIANK